MSEKLDELPPEIAAAIKLEIQNYKEAIIANPRLGVWIVSQLVAAFSKQFQINPLQHMQNVLTKLNVDLKFVAIPKGSELDRYGFVDMSSGVAMLSDTNHYAVGLPHDPEGDYPFYLHTILNRIEEYDEYLTLLKVSPEENFKRLARTGMLMQKPGSLEARITISPYN